MNSERWHQIEEIYCSALEIEPGQREAFLKQRCSGDALLLREVERLLKRQPEAEDFIESPAVEVAARALFEDSAEGSAAASKDGAANLAIEDPADVRTPLPDPQPAMDATLETHPKRAPWWMYVIAAIFLICAGIRYYQCYVLPDDSNLGWSLQTAAGRNGESANLITAVQPGSLAARAGARPGDLVFPSRSDGFLMSPEIPRSGRHYWKAGRTYAIEVERNGERKVIDLTLGRRALRDWIHLSNFRSGLSALLAGFLELAIGFVIAFRKPLDLTARLGALFLAVLGIVMIHSIFLTIGDYDFILSFPAPIRWLIVLLPLACKIFLPSAWITFAACFPRRLFTRDWIWGLVWIAPALIFSPYVVFSDGLLPLYASEYRSPGWYVLLYSSFGIFIFCAMFAVPILIYRRLIDPNERRRVRVVMVGAVITLITIVVPSIFWYIVPNSNFGKWLLGPPYHLTFVITCLSCAFPAAMAYAILKHRLFDIRIIIRQGVRYAAARGLLLSLVPVVAIIWVGDLLLHRSQPFGEILSKRGMLYAVLACGGLILHLYRKNWVNALDKRFFREHYNAHQVLRNVIEEIRSSRSFEKVAPQVILQIDSALHPQSAAILLRQHGASAFRVLVEGNTTVMPVAADSRLMALMRVLNKPVEISPDETGWPWRHLPAEESEFLRRARLEWLFPISLGEGQTEALLAVGPKRSESPYSKEDQELLEGITSSLALLLEQTATGILDSGGFKECPECGTCYDSDSDSCKKEGASLTPLPYARMLARRYWFERKLGKGGMGIVYESHDTELDRHVAIKLIHPMLMSSTEAAARFRQEARAAAGFTHPNVVTIYDYGVAEDGRAYLVMELLRGVTLRQELKRRQRLDAARVYEILSGVSAAVDTAHRRGLIHRDLKPENIFLAKTDDGETPKILDFGVVKTLTRSEEDTAENETEPGRLVGTLKYMSPEELRGENPTEGWDLWALTVVAYEMLAGVHPFNGSTSSETRNAIIDGRMAPIDSQLPEAPASLRQFFEKALASDRRLRPPSASQFLSDFMQSIQ
jgi:hypothetical protein